MQRTEFLQKLTMNEDLQSWTSTAFTVNNSSMYHYEGKENPYLDKTVMQAREYSKLLQAKMEKDVLSGVEVIKQELPAMKKEIIDKSKKSMASMGYNKKIIEGA